MVTMKAGTTPIFKSIWYDWAQHQPGIEPTNPFRQCWVPPFRHLLRSAWASEERTYASPGSSIRSPHLGSPWAHAFSQVILRCRGGDHIHDMMFLFILAPASDSPIVIAGRLGFWDTSLVCIITNPRAPQRELSEYVFLLKTECPSIPFRTDQHIF